MESGRFDLLVGRPVFLERHEADVVEQVSVLSGGCGRS